MSCSISHVVVISIDGLRPDALQQADTPTLDALRLQGAYTAQAQAVVPSVTLINHASMLGGMNPDKHGIYWNNYEPELGNIQGPTLFSAGEEAGLSTALLVGKDKLQHLVSPDYTGLYHYAGFTDQQVMNVAFDLAETAMPNLLFIHLPNVDSSGHTLGWMSSGQLLAIELTDTLIGEFVAHLDRIGLLEETVLLITSDHGGSDFGHGSDSPEDTLIPWLAVGPGVLSGLTIEEEVVTYDTAATALS
ncbi:MAG: ectonucleotide pyrophosphatase/phosphodiesterase, partial [Chloroflexota bacterium]